MIRDEGSNVRRARKDRRGAGEASAARRRAVVAVTMNRDRQGPAVARTAGAVIMRATVFRSLWLVDAGAVLTLPVGHLLHHYVRLECNRASAAAITVVEDRADAACW